MVAELQTYVARVDGPARAVDGMRRSVHERAEVAVGGEPCSHGLAKRQPPLGAQQDLRRPQGSSGEEDHRRRGSLLPTVGAVVAKDHSVATASALDVTHL